MLLACACSALPQAAVPTGPPDEAGGADGTWEVSAKPYLWAAGLEGQVGIDNAGAPVEAEFGDLLGSLDFGAMLGVEAGRVGSPWAWSLDTVFIDLGKDSSRADADIKQAIVELDVIYGPASWRGLELLAGVRYFGISTDLEVGPAEASSDEEWVEPLVGARGVVPLAPQLSLGLRGDVCGFGLGSELTYQLAAVLRYTLSAHADLGVGYRHLDIDYDHGGFEYDVATSGPVLGLDWSF